MRPSRLPFLIFCLYTFVLIGRPQDYLPSLEPLRLALVFTVLTSLVSAFSLSWTTVLRHTETKLYLTFFAVMCAGIPFSVYPRASFEFVVFRYLVNIIFFLMFVTHVNTAVRYKRVVLVLATSTLIFSATGLLGGEFLKGRYMTGSNIFDPNDVVFVELALLPFSLCILFDSFRVTAKAMAMAGVLLGFLLALYTGSRGGLLGLLTMMLLFLVVRIGGVGKSRKLILVALIVIAGTLNADKINLERYLTLGELENDYNMNSETGRAQVWRRGMGLFMEHRIIGVGVSRFGEAIGTMRKEEDAVPEWQASHNAYIQVLVETGMLGTAPFVLLFITCLATFNRFRRIGHTILGPDLASLPGLLLIGFCGQAMAAMFLSQAYSIPFTLYFAAAAALKGIAAKTPPVTQ